MCVYACMYVRMCVCMHVPYISIFTFFLHFLQPSQPSFPTRIAGCRSVRTVSFPSCEAPPYACGQLVPNEALIFYAYKCKSIPDVHL